MKTSVRSSGGHLTLRLFTTCSVFVIVSLAEWLVEPRFYYYYYYSSYNFVRVLHRQRLVLCHRSARQLQPADKHKDGTVVEERVAVANVANSAAETKRSSVTTSLSDLLSLPHRCFKQVFVVVVFPHQHAHTHTLDWSCQMKSSSSHWCRSSGGSTVSSVLQFKALLGFIPSTCRRPWHQSFPCSRRD